jgi:PAS domain S-box-containing protein
MTEQLFAQHVTLHQLKVLEKGTGKLQQIPEKLLQQINQLPEQPQAVLLKSLTALSDSLAELEATRQMLLIERQRYQEMLEASPIGYIETTLEAVVLEANLSAAELLNTSQKRLIGKSLAIFIMPGDRDRFYTQLTQLQDAQAVKNWKINLQRRRGVTCLTVATVIPVLDKQGKITRLRWQLQDISDRQHTLEALRHQQIKCRSIFENNVVGMAILNRQGYAVESNCLLQEMLGFSPRKLQQNPFAKLINPKKPSAQETLLQQVLSGQRSSYQIEERFIHKEGQILWLRITCSLIQSSENKSPLVTCVVEDITQIKANNSQLYGES